MKKMRTGLFFASAIIFVLFSCNNDHLSGPYIPSGSGGGGERSILSPEGIRASQGEKRGITLSWDQNPNAVRYYIYNSDSPLNTFARCGETDSNQFKFNVSPGSTIYYRVSSVSYDGTESVQSAFVRGTSLAQPFITDITDITESVAAVTWYMENVFEDSYKDNLLYNVYCFNGATEVAQIELDARDISENRAVFTGLTPNTRYEYQVEAYLRSDQSVSEKSDKMDAATARRFRPGAPVDLTVSCGTAVSQVTLSFELPDMVDIALGDNKFDPKPLYFVIKKRFYSESGNNEYQKAISYFGSITGKGVNFGSYIPGATVTWVDENVSRGVKYEYLVQSYVDDTIKQITSDSSKSSEVGWALSEGTLSFGKIESTLGEGVNLYVSAKLPLNFEFDPLGETYGYKLKEKIEPLEDGESNDPIQIINREIAFDTYDEIKAHIPTMNLTRQTTQTNPGRGIYSYKIEILLNDEVLDTVSTIGKKEVSENTDPVIVENFRVQDGYTDRFVLKWDYYDNRKYTIYIVDHEGTIVEEIGSVNGNPNDFPTASLTPNTNYSYTYSAEDIKPGVTRYFAVKPSRKLGENSFKNGQLVYTDTASKTLGVPTVSQENVESSYSTITASWTEAQKADAYRVRYRYPGETDYRKTPVVSKGSLTVDAFGKYKYTFKPEGDEVPVDKAGLEIEIQVDALNEGLRVAAGVSEISTTTSSKEDVRTRLVGPALLGLSARKATSAQEITVSWNKISGASGYYVFRRQFDMTNTAEEGTEAVVYYVPADETLTVPVTGKGLLRDASNSKVDTPTTAASVKFMDGQYTLIDRHMTDSEYDDGFTYDRHTHVYRDQQNDIVQGYSYRYYVVPVISGTDLGSIEFAYNKDSGNKNTDIASYTMENGAVKYSGKFKDLEQEGFTIGFGQNVTATKGTYTSSGNINNGVRITWSAPPRLSSVSDFNPRYNVYRRESGGSGWETLKLDVNATEYIETQLPGTRGTAYEYAVGISGSGGTSDPKLSKRFIDKCYTQLDEKGRPKMLGFMLDQVLMESVSRNEQKVDGKFAEEVKWKSAGIKNRVNGVDNKWGIDGYEVWVMNRNINAAWHKITEIPYANIPDEIDQSVKVTTGMGSVTIYPVSLSGGSLTLDLLHVMRDYRHFFKVRNYVLNDDNERIYSPDLNYDYKYYWKDNERYKFETDYVKWGARQITATEFVKIAMVHMSDGIQEINGNKGSWYGIGSWTKDASGDGTSGSVGSKHNGSTNWEFTFTNYKTDLLVRTGEWQHFLTINGRLWGHTSLSYQYPYEWGYLDDIEIKGPSDTPNLYTGKMAVGGGTQRGGSVYYNDLKWGDGDISVKYSAGSTDGSTANPAIDQKLTMKGENTPMVFKGESDQRYNLEEYK